MLVINTRQRKICYTYYMYYQTEFSILIYFKPNQHNQRTLVSGWNIMLNYMCIIICNADTLHAELGMAATCIMLVKLINEIQ